MEEKYEHPYVTSYRHFLTALGFVCQIVIGLFITGYIQGAFAWHSSADIASNMAEPTAYTGSRHK